MEAALKAGRRALLRLVLKAGRAGGDLSERLEALRALATGRGVPIEEAAPAELEARCGSATHQGAILRCGPLPLRPVEEALALAERAHAGSRPAGGALTPASQGGATPDLTPAAGAAAPSPPAEGQRGREAAAPDRVLPYPVLVALDQVEDPRNLGAVVRACAVFGAAGVVVPRHHSAPVSPAASKASAGHLERLPIYEAANLARFLEQAREGGWWVAGTAAEGGQPLHATALDRPLVLVFGSEGRGMRPLVQRGCDFLLTIGTPGGESLNVASAAAVVLYQLLRPGGGDAPRAKG